MNGWIWTLVVMLVLDIVGSPLAVGTERTPGQMFFSGVCTLLVIWALLHLGGVL